MSLDVLDWRRQTRAMYDAVRTAGSPRQGHGLWQETRARMFRDHPASASRTARLNVAAYNPELRFVVSVEPAAEPLEIALPTASDGVVPFTRLGAVQLAGVGALDVWWLASYGGGVWLPIRDASADTYGGGRYVLDTVKGADLGGEAGQLVVDLNFAYNPSCAYDEAWACPLAPPGNVTAVAVEAGELLPR